MTKMKKNELDNYIRNAVVTELGLGGRGDTSQIGNSAYAMRVETPEGDYFAKIAITACQRKDTKVNPAFDLDTAVAKFEEERAEKLAKAEKRAAEHAKKVAAAKKN